MQMLNLSMNSKGDEKPKGLMDPESTYVNTPFLWEKVHILIEKC